MEKHSCTIEGRVLEYTKDTLACASSRFQSSRIDWGTLLNKGRKQVLDASHAKGEHLSPIFDRIGTDMREKGFSEDSIFKFYISVWEAVYNAQKHTCCFTRGKQVYLHVCISPEFAFVGIRAKGKEYNIGKGVEYARTASQELLREGGRGIYLMTKCDFLFGARSGNYSEIFLGQFPQEDKS